jgi:guanylate kinase
MEPDKTGKIFVISGPSGVGKSTIVRGAGGVVEKTGIPVCVSATTRPQGKTEVNGKDYWFITRDEFEQKIENEEFLEYAKVFDNWYGTPKKEVEDRLAKGQSVILEIDTQGGLSVKTLYPDATVVMIFILPPSNDVLQQRMSKRGRETDIDSQIAHKRLKNASNEIAMAWQHYEHMVINDVLENAINEITGIIKTETGENKE